MPVPPATTAVRTTRETAPLPAEDSAELPAELPAAGSVTDLVAAAAAGDRGAWTEIMARYGAMVRAVAGGFRLQEADAADAVQNTWVRALERVHTVREPERLGGWLRTTARRECLSLLAAAGRERVDEEVGEALVESAPGPEALVLHDEVRRVVREAVDALPERRRTLVDVLFFGWPGDYAAASTMMGMPVGSIGPTRGRTLRDLRTRLEARGVADAGGCCGGVGWDLPVAPVRPGLPVGRAPGQPAAGGAGSTKRLSCVRERMPSFR